MSSTSVSPELRELSIQEMVALMMPPKHERVAKHVSTSDQWPTRVINFTTQSRGRHRAEPIAAALYLTDDSERPRHRAQPTNLFDLVNNTI